MEEMCGGRTRFEEGNLYKWAKRELIRLANYDVEFDAYNWSFTVGDERYGRECRLAWAAWEERAEQRKFEVLMQWERQGSQ